MAEAPKTDAPKAEAPKKEEQEKQGAPEVVKYKGDEKKRWQSLKKIFNRGSESFAPPMFDVEEDTLQVLAEDFRVLVVGAGGLGCELLKNLALSGFKDIEVIDLDTIELSNLNRQFLFRKKDIGKPKAKCAAEFVMNRVPGCSIKWYQKPIQEFSKEFYSKFNCVIAGLDNIEARRWLNSTLCELVSKDENGEIDPDTIIPFIDGGTEGFLGQARLFIPMVSACFECSVGTITRQRGFQSCTIASIPRRPEHCIAYAHKILWRRLKSLKTADNYEMEEKDINVDGVNLDKDDVEHMSWIYNRALERAKEFNIEGVTYTKTQQVVKNIIPAIASTNALISAVCVNECFKALTWSSFGLNNYFMFMGQDGIYSRTFEYKKNPQCPVCGTLPQKYKIDDNQLFLKLYQKIVNDPVLKLKDPSISTSAGKALFVGGGMKKFYQDNLKKKINELITDNIVLNVTDPNLGNMAARIEVKFEEGAIYIAPDDDENNNKKTETKK